MKPWMIWTAAGVLGVVLAIAAIPFITSPDPAAWTPTVVGSGVGGSVGTGGVARVADTASGGSTVGSNSTNPATPNPPANNGLTPIDEPEAVDPDQAFVNPGRKAREELLARPDMVLIRNADSRWRSVVRSIADKPHDPAADHTMKRIEQLRRDIEAYRTDPNTGDIEELMGRQKHILGELKQSTYWGPDLAQTEAQLDQSFQIYRTTPATTP